MHVQHVISSTGQLERCSAKKVTIFSFALLSFLREGYSKIRRFQSRTKGSDEGLETSNLIVSCG